MCYEYFSLVKLYFEVGNYFTMWLILAYSEEFA